jgi:hypothetical protein
VFSRGWRSAEPAIDPSVVAKQKVIRSVLAGDFDAATAEAGELEALVKASESSFTRGPAAEYSITIAKEIDRNEQALERARRFAAEMTGLDVRPDIDLSIDMDNYIYDMGGMTSSEFS